jgi:hypothetical protein
MSRRMRTLRMAPLALALLWPLAGCTPYTGFAVETVEQEQAQSVPTDITARTYHSVDAIIAELQRSEPILLQQRTPAVVGSVADIADVNHSTPLGNIIADLVRSRLVQRGVPVTDMRLRSAVQLDRFQGEMVLSRNSHLVYPAPVTGTIVTGTYAVAHGSVIVSLKMIQATDARILAAADFRLPRSADVDRLLQGPLASAR